MRKYTRTDENAAVLPPDQTKVIEDELAKIGKTSARDLTDDERTDLNSALDKSDE